MIDMKVKAIAPWFGGKRTLASEIVRELGPHGQYFEPFCGSLAVLFAKPKTQKETVCDLHGDLTNLAWVLQEEAAAPRLYERLQRVLFCESLLREAVNRLQAQPPESHIPLDPDGDQVERAYWFFIASWFMRNGVAGTARMEYQIAVRWTKNGGSPTVRWKHALESIPAWHERLRNVVIVCRNAFEILDRFEDVPETAIYCDPPYVPDSRSGFGGHGGGSKYLHEFTHESGLFGECDHTRLRDLLKAYKRARIVVSYYDCPRVRELYRGWRFVEHRRQKQLANQRDDAPEILIVNGPPVS